MDGVDERIGGRPACVVMKPNRTNPACPTVYIQLRPRDEFNVAALTRALPSELRDPAVADWISDHAAGYHADFLKYFSSGLYTEYCRVVDSGVEFKLGMRYGKEGNHAL